MTHRAVLLLCCMILASWTGLGCPGDDDHDVVVGEAMLPLVHIAVGAEVEVQFSDLLCPPHTNAACVAQVPVTVSDVYLEGEGVFQLGDWSEGIGAYEIGVMVTALQAGEVVLWVDGTDDNGAPVRAGAVLRASQLTHVEAAVVCDEGVAKGDDGAVVVSASTELIVFLRGMADDTELACGWMRLIEDIDGFTDNYGDGTGGLVTSPDVGGSYTWTLVGEASEPLEWLVYEPKDVAASLLPDGDDALLVERAVDGGQACRHEGDAFVFLDVTSGPCLLMMHDYAIDGSPVRVNLAHGSASIDIAGDGNCTIEARTEAGTVTSATMLVHNLVGEPQAGSGAPLTPTPIEVGGRLPERSACSNMSVTDEGDCELIGDSIIPNADCFTDYDWISDVFEIYAPKVYSNVNGQNLGVGLSVELHIGLRFEILFMNEGTYAVDQLAFGAAPAGGIAVDHAGCIAFDRTVLAVRPTAPGSYAIHYSSYYVNDGGQTVVNAHPIARAVYDLGDAGPQVDYFVGTLTPVKVGYLDASDADLRGIAPITAQSDDAAAGATVDTGTDGAVASLATGAKPNVITLESPAAPNGQIVNVVDVQGIAAMTGPADQTLAVGQSACLASFPVNADGRRIYGTMPDWRRVSLDGNGLVVDGEASELCLAAVASGTTQVRVSLGDADHTSSWLVP